MNKKIARLGEKTNLTKEDLKKFTKIGLSGLLALTLTGLTGLGSEAAAQEQQMPAKDGQTNERAQKCDVVPEKGNCKALFTTYYYDPAQNKCVEAIGCVSSVFDTKDECAKSCVVKKPGGDAFMGHKYGGVGIRDFR